MIYCINFTSSEPTSECKTLIFNMRFPYKLVNQSYIIFSYWIDL